MAYKTINLKERFLEPVRFTGSEPVSLARIQRLLKVQANEKGIRLSFREDVLCSGGLFRRRKERVLILCHPHHQDTYPNLLIRLVQQGKDACMEVFTVGGAAKARVRRLFGRYNAQRERELYYQEIFHQRLSDCLEGILDQLPWEPYH